MTFKHFASNATFLTENKAENIFMWKSAALTLYDCFRISRVNENKKVLTICAAVLRYERHNHKGWHKFQNFKQPLQLKV
jgi:hypothetical protein